MPFTAFSIRLSPAIRHQILARSTVPVTSSFMRYYATKLYTKQHEWVKIEDGVATIGITDYGKKSLGDIGFIQISETGAYLKGERLAVMISGKRESEITFPISGKKLSVNQDVHMHPKLLNDDPENKGWLCKIKPFDDRLEEETKSLLSEESYKKLIK
ncbi:hypothetical protein BGX27_004179 [Mortierella sp. AM989]|nr:hypothetical protein BGX27_004179 [Mortierella sp. AM989]